MDKQQKDWQLKCSTHQDEDVIYIQVNDIQENKSIFYCESCINTDYSFKPQNFVRVKQVIQSNLDSIIFNWPPLDDNHLQKQLIQIVNTYKQQSKIIEDQINSYFNDLKTKINDKISEAQKRAINTVSELFQIESQLKKTYQDVTNVNKFKGLLLDININQQLDKEKSIRQFINELLQSKKQNQETFLKLFQKQDQMIKSVDYDRASEVVKDILLKLDEMNIFQQQQNLQVYSVDKNQINSSIHQIQNNNNYPLLENKNKEDLLSKLKFVNSQHKHDKSCGLLSIKQKSNNQIIFENIISENNFSLGYYTDFILDRNKQYKFRVQLNYFVQDKYDPSFRIGLVNDEKKDIQLCSVDNLSCQISIKNNQFNLTNYSKGLQKVIQGDFKTIKIDKELELSVSLNENILELYDYPEKKHIATLKEEYKENLTLYQNLRFFIKLHKTTSIKMTACFAE